VTARLRRARGHARGAIQAWEEAAACRRGDSLLGPGIILERMRHKALADIVTELGRDRQALGDLAGAEEAFAEARALYVEIGKPYPGDAPAG